MSENETRERLVRWEKTRRQQLGVVITLVFGLASAALAFCGSLLNADEAEFGG